MAKVTLIKPRSYRIAGVTFHKGAPQIVTEEFAREHLVDENGRPIENFDVVFASDIEAVAAAGVRTAVKRPSDADARVEQIQRAAASLDPANPAHYTKAGKVQTAALTELLGWVVSAADRDEALLDKVKSVPAADAPAKKVVTTTEHVEGGAKIKITRRTKVQSEKGDIKKEDITGAPVDAGDGVDINPEVPGDTEGAASKVSEEEEREI